MGLERRSEINLSCPGEARNGLSHSKAKGALPWANMYPLLILFVFGDIPSGAQKVTPESVLRGHSGRAQGPYEMLEIEPRLVACKASALPTVLWLQPQSGPDSGTAYERKIPEAQGV